MKITSIFKVAGLCAVLTLASCGGDSGTTAPTTTSGTSAGTTVAPNTGTVTVNTAPNNVVSIGASGTNFKTVDATGKAVFTGLTPGAVDVHVFSADGYSATSYMGVNAANIVDATGVTNSSVIDVYVQLINADVYGQNVYFQTANNTYQGLVNSTTGNATVFVWDKPAGTAITGTVYVAQGLATSSAGNTVSGGAAEKLNLGSYSFTTTAMQGAAQANLTANFAAVTPTPLLLATMSSVIPPAGMVVDALGLGDVFIDNGGLAVTLPDTIRSVTLGDHYFFGASDANGNQWSFSGIFTAGDTLTATATLNLPTMTANQAGSTLSWVNNSTAQSLNIVDIYDMGYVHDWTVMTAAQVNSITLPIVPTIATASLMVGTTYSVDIISVKNVTGASYEQLIAFFSSGGRNIGEATMLSAVPYTR